MIRGSAASACTEHVRSRTPRASLVGCGRGATWDASGVGAASGVEPYAMPANTAPVPRRTNTTPSAENSQAFGCLRIAAKMPPLGAMVLPFSSTRVAGSAPVFCGFSRGARRGFGPSVCRAERREGVGSSVTQQ
jgi:hypothetical protein